MTLRQRILPYLMIVPAVVLILIFTVYPIVDLIRLSFTSWNLLDPVKTYVGWANYRALCSDPAFIRVLLNTFAYTVLTVTLCLATGLLLALWLNRRGAWHGFARAAVFSPHIISLVSVSLLWLWMMDPQFGLLNWVLVKLGAGRFPWLTHPDTALVSLVLVQVWKSAGYNALVLIAGLQSVPRELYEAADLDLTPPWRRFVRITLPMLSPTLFFLLVVNTIDSFKVFDTIAVMTQGGPVNSTNMLVYYVYENAFHYFKIGYASAAGVVLLALTGLMTFLHFGLLARRVHYR
jgi:sn-glycerol 3-phosphate transport system permease protein